MEAWEWWQGKAGCLNTIPLRLLSHVCTVSVPRVLWTVLHDPMTVISTRIHCRDFTRMYCGQFYMYLLVMFFIQWADPFALFLSSLSSLSFLSLSCIPFVLFPFLLLLAKSTTHREAKNATNSFPSSLSSLHQPCHALSQRRINYSGSAFQEWQTRVAKRHGDNIALAGEENDTVTYRRGIDHFVEDHTYDYPTLGRLLRTSPPYHLPFLAVARIIDTYDTDNEKMSSQGGMGAWGGGEGIDGDEWAKICVRDNLRRLCLLLTNVL